MTCDFGSMIFSLESSSHFRACKHGGTLVLPKCIVSPLRSRPSACLISSKHSLFSVSISSHHATLPAQSYPQQEEKSRQLFNDDITEFLLKECGVSDRQLPTINRKIKVPLSLRKFLHTARQVLQFFRDLGFTPHQVRTVIGKYPNLLTLKVDGLKPKIDLLTTLGLTGEDLAMVITRMPRILGSSLEENLNPKIRLLANLFGSEAHLSQAIKRAPDILLIDSNVTGNVAMKVKQMKSIGLLEDEIKDMLKKAPRLLCLTTETLDKKLNNMTNLGLSDEQIKQVHLCI
ncbi:transcription termination factor MTERF5, chloroplastic isoform X2 [Cryptomeria japonica]|uniref:transcription termination factor MTERF5, chloroplastic isoform X2 n=1 Tax=Cryptomeria japonica TaxID=3369 RepID=UPI0027D9EBEB|nr:transcription termination factor MTERF5, chloroplastic isoform X2 [Cryptomeria japonica]